MADTKITSLQPPQVGYPVVPATDVLPIVVIADPGMATSGSTRKVTVNQLLGAGGTATLASATITGDLTVRTNQLVVNSSGSFVGKSAGAVGTDGVQLLASGFSGFSASGTTALFLNRNTSDGTVLQLGRSGASAVDLGAIAGGGFTVGLSGSEWMRIDSTGLGVGVVPGSGKIAARAGTAATGNSIYADNIDGTYNPWVQIQHSSAGIKIFNSSSFGGSSNNLIFGNGTTSETMRIDSSGNVGIGGAPATAVANNRKLEIVGTINSAVVLGSNSSNASARNWATASNWNAYGDLAFLQSNALGGDPLASGAGTTRMTLDSGGNLLVGVTSAGGNRLNVQTASGDCLMLVKSQAANTNSVIDYVSNYGNYTIRKSGTAVWDYGVISDSSATPAFKIQNASSVGVQLVSGATAWTTLSDETMKDIIEPISNAVAKVGSLRSVIGKFKTDDASKRRSFLIAQDVQSVLPEAVDVIGENNELGLRYTEVIPLLVAAIKELTARVQTLEAK